MRILIIDNSAIVKKNGIHYTNALNGQFFSELKDTGNEISCIQFATERNDSISVYALEPHKIRFTELASKRNKILRYLFSIPTLIKGIRRNDFIYLYYPNSLRWVILLCLLGRKPYGLYLRGMNGVDDYVSRMLYKRAMVVFTVSSYFSEMVNSYSTRGIAHTIRPMISYTDKDVVLNRMYAPKCSYRWLYLGRITKDKGLGELIAAAKCLHERGYKFDLQIVGNGEYIDHLKEIADRDSMLGYTHFDGPIYDDEEKSRCYQNADLFVLPTYHEGFPRTLYEAMIFGTPIITTFVGGIPSLMRENQNCLKIESHSVNSIVEKMAYAMDHYEVMAKLAQVGTRIVTDVIDHRKLSHAQHLNQILNNYGQ